jgi:hypothetical protein
VLLWKEVAARLWKFVHTRGGKQSDSPSKPGGSTSNMLAACCCILLTGNHTLSELAWH